LISKINRASTDFPTKITVAVMDLPPDKQNTLI
jgi:hypothetical protein